MKKTGRWKGLFNYGVAVDSQQIPITTFTSSLAYTEGSNKITAVKYYMYIQLIKIKVIKYMQRCKLNLQAKYCNNIY